MSSVNILHVRALEVKHWRIKLHSDFLLKSHKIFSIKCWNRHKFFYQKSYLIINLKIILKEAKLCIKITSIWNVHNKFILEEFKAFNSRSVLLIIYCDLQKGHKACLFSNGEIKESRNITKISQENITESYFKKSGNVIGWYMYCKNTS